MVSLLQIGTPREIYETPADRYVASRLGTPPINFLSADLLPHAAMPPGTKTLGIRTEHLQSPRPVADNLPGASTALNISAIKITFTWSIATACW